MANSNFRDVNIVKWLHNKLETADSWPAGSICSQLNSDILRNIKDSFQLLNASVKLKFLLLFFEMPLRNIQEWRTELEDILEVAQSDLDDWVSIIAEIMRNYPANGSISSDNIEKPSNKRLFDELLRELSKQLKKPIDYNMLPLECLYMNRAALSKVIPQIPTPTKHFTLKRKPKSAALKAELIQKSIDMSNMKKNVAPAVPVRSRGMPRKLTDTTPLKGIPSRIPIPGFRTSVLSSTTNRPVQSRSLSGRKDCAIKLLDINEQPIGYVQAKKRKRLEMEESKRSLDESQNSSTSILDTSTPVSSTIEIPSQPTSTPSTPDYANGLAPTETVADIKPELDNEGKSELPQTEASQQSQSHTDTVNNVQETTELPRESSSNSTPTAAYTSVITDASTIKAEQEIAQPESSSPVQEQPQAVQQKNKTKAVKPATTVPSDQVKSVSVAFPATRQNIQLNIPANALAEATEMFKTANVVTTPEKLLILQFMGGSRENPCPNLGHLMTIKLSEKTVNTVDDDGKPCSMIVEMHFQMNYQTGSWSWVEKRKNIVENKTSNVTTMTAVAPVTVTTNATTISNTKTKQKRQQKPKNPLPC